MSNPLTGAGTIDTPGAGPSLPAERRSDVTVAETLDCDVAIVGGGPAGLMLAIELGVRNVACVVFDENTGPPRLPKANATSARTMEHYRRRGFAGKIRALGLPAGHPQDIIYTTRLARHELTRFRIPSSDQAATQQSFGDYREEAWPTPELPHRAQQMFIEPILKEQAQRYPSVRIHSGRRVTSVRDEGDRVRVESLDVVSGAVSVIAAPVRRGLRRAAQRGAASDRDAL